MCLNTHKDSYDYYWFTKTGSSYGTTHLACQDPDLAFLFSVSHTWTLLRTFWLGLDDQKVTYQQLKTKSSFHIISRRKGVCHGCDFFPPFTSSWRTMDWGWEMEERSRVWLPLLLPCHAQGLVFTSKTQQSSFRLKYASSPHSVLLPFSTAWPLSSPPLSQPHLAWS